MGAFACLVILPAKFNTTKNIYYFRFNSMTIIKYFLALIMLRT
jgi:hypothetical protein